MMSNILNEQIAEKLISKVFSLLKKRIMVFNLRADVVASSDLSETNKNYEQVLKAIEADSDIEISTRGPNKLNQGIIIPICYSGEVIGAVFIEDRPEEYNHYRKILRTTIELLIHQDIILDHIPYKDKIKDNFVFGLLHRRLAIEDPMVKEEAEMLELRPNRDKVVVIMNVVDFWQTLFRNKISAAEDEKQIVLSSYKKEVFRSFHEFFGHLSGCTVAYLGSDVFVVLVDELSSMDGNEMVKVILKKSDELRKILTKYFGNKFSKVLLSVGNFYRGKEGPALAYEEATKALALGLSMGSERDLYHIDDLGMLATLAGGNKKWQTDFVRRLITKMTGQEYLVETTEAFFDNNMNITQTAEALKIHRNTLLYRLDKINKVSGLDPRKFNDAIELKLALILNRIHMPGNIKKVESGKLLIET